MAEESATTNGTLNRSASTNAVVNTWDRSWTLDELRSETLTWTLASDAGLSHYLQEFSAKILQKTKDIESQVDSLLFETKATDVRVHNAFNEFLMLSNKQFIENRVYEDDETAVAEKKPEPVAPTKDLSESVLIPKYTEAISLGVQILMAFASAQEPEEADAETEEAEKPTPKKKKSKDHDEWAKNPLPAIIGTREFNEDDYCGLHVEEEEEEPEEEKEKTEAQADSDEFSSDEEEQDVADDEETGEDHTATAKQESSDEERDETSAPAKPRTFVDELSGALQKNQNQDGTQAETAAPVTAKKKAADDDMFADFQDEPKGDDDLFGGDFGGIKTKFKQTLTFNESSEVDDLFADKSDAKPQALFGAEPTEQPKEPAPKKKLPPGAVGMPGLFDSTEFGGNMFTPKPDEPSKSEVTEAKSEAPKPARAKTGGLGLFGADEAEADDMFSSSKSIKSSGGLFDDDSLFGGEAKPKKAPSKQATLFEGGGETKPTPEKPKASLFGDFGADEPKPAAAPAKQSSSKNLFDADSLFGDEPKPKPAKQEAKSAEDSFSAAPKETEPEPAPKKKIIGVAMPGMGDMIAKKNTAPQQKQQGLFGDDPEPAPAKTAPAKSSSGSLFGDAEPVKETAAPAKTKAAPSLFGDDAADDIFSFKPKEKKEVKKEEPKKVEEAPKKSLFGGDDIAEPEPKPQPKKEEPVSPKPEPAKPTKPMSLFGEPEEEEAMFSKPTSTLSSRKSSSLFGGDESESSAPKSAKPLSASSSESLFESPKPSAKGSAGASLFGDSGAGLAFGGLPDDLFGGSKKAEPPKKEVKKEEPPKAVSFKAADEATEDPLGGPKESKEDTPRMRSSSKVSALQARLSLDPSKMLGGAPPKRDRSASSGESMLPAPDAESPPVPKSKEPEAEAEPAGPLQSLTKDRSAAKGRRPPTLRRGAVAKESKEPATSATFSSVSASTSGSTSSPFESSLFGSSGPSFGSSSSASSATSSSSATLSTKHIQKTPSDTVSSIFDDQPFVSPKPPTAKTEPSVFADPMVPKVPENLPKSEPVKETKKAETKAAPTVPEPAASIFAAPSTTNDVAFSIFGDIPTPEKPKKTLPPKKKAEEPKPAEVKPTTSLSSSATENAEPKPKAAPAKAKAAPAAKAAPSIFDDLDFMSPAAAAPAPVKSVSKEAKPAEPVAVVEPVQAAPSKAAETKEAPKKKKVVKSPSTSDGFSDIFADPTAKKKAPEPEVPKTAAPSIFDDPLEKQPTKAKKKAAPQSIFD
eukprot:TRINITY_DN2885_c0_g1_i4.p1 TRINITY_DN2885_c0_g1~~TRINITY_DN2885_c0_g1_i4.p1  ORF type:complete len:1256 (-),score=484.30 TRINITY_DN2885_c0_g1_i4:54-3821(-)